MNTSGTNQLIREPVSRTRRTDSGASAETGEGLGAGWGETDGVIHGAVASGAKASLGASAAGLGLSGWGDGAWYVGAGCGASTGAGAGAGGDRDSGRGISSLGSSDPNSASSVS